MSLSFKPSLDPVVAAESLRKLVACHIDPLPFQLPIRRLERIYAAYAAYAPLPWPARGLVLTPEDHYQSELWLPLSVITPVFYRFYQAALKYPPILSSTPFATASSWAGIVASLPAGFHASSPAVILKQLLEEHELRLKFLFHSFMPQRFYGKGFDRYPEQHNFIRSYVQELKGKVNCLDAACGDGFGCYTLGRMLLEHKIAPELFRIEGWTLDPLECWSAAHGNFPHDNRKTIDYQKFLESLIARGGDLSIIFKQRDLLDKGSKTGHFDLIICNGLLGGPIIHEKYVLNNLIVRLGELLAPGGMLLVADNFHAGWKKKCPQEGLRALFVNNSFECFNVGEGIGCRKSS
ncbi:MAG: hypothetical protein A2079_00865 [Geobacteraceae bacterium GWC2_48_7]|nr:MAG: hypothetical protein A2079_00865 [Geobacteraceae bacterium GWC2_48_7]